MVPRHAERFLGARNDARERGLKFLLRGMNLRSADRKSLAENSFRVVKNGYAQRGIELQHAENRCKSFIFNRFRYHCCKRRIAT